MRKKEVLVSLEHPDGTAGVFTDTRGRVWLSGYLEERGGTLLDGFGPAREGLDGDHFVHGGRLPPGATGAVVIDASGEEHRATAGNGAWLAVTEMFSIFADLPIRFTGDGGEVVAPPRPGGMRLGPIDDAIDDCPACGAREWGAPSIAGEAVVCRRCGHEVGIGSMMLGTAFSDRADSDQEEAEEEEERWMRSYERRYRREQSRVLKRVRFPVYAVRGRAGMLTGWGSTGRKITELTVAHGERGGSPWVRVETSRREPFYETDLAVARRAMELTPSSRVTHAEPPPATLSVPALSLWFAARRRDQLRTAARADGSTRELAVDGKPLTFTVVSSDQVWAAVARTADQMQLTITAEGVPIDEVELVTVDDPLSLLE